MRGWGDGRYVPGLVLLALAGLVGVPYNPLMIVLVVAELMLIALMITAFGVMVAARIKTFQAFMAMTQVLMLPMFFLSGRCSPQQPAHLVNDPHPHQPTHVRGRFGPSDDLRVH